MTNPFENLFNTNASGGLFSSNETGGNEEAKKQTTDDASEKDLFGNPIAAEPDEVKKESAKPVKAEPVKAQPTKETVVEPTKPAEKKAEPAKKTPKKTPIKDIKVGPTWNIAYAAQQYNPPEVDMTLEDVRKWLELDYPELSLERTAWDVDETKLLVVPIVKGSKMG